MQIVDATSLPWPVQSGAPTCAVMVAGGVRIGPDRCQSVPAAFMLVSYPSGRDVWCVFLCAVHAEAVPLAEPLDKVAAAELHDRQEQHRLALAGQHFRRPTPLQSARG